jgi:hypothetical protein
LACHTWPHFRQARLVAALLARGADPAARDARGCTPLHYACRSADRGAVGQLLAAGADPSAEALPAGGAGARAAGPRWTRGDGDGSGGQHTAGSPAAAAAALSLERSLLLYPQPLQPPGLAGLEATLAAALRGPAAKALAAGSKNGSSSSSSRAHGADFSGEASPWADNRLPGDLRSGGGRRGADGSLAFGAGLPRGPTPLLSARPEDRAACFATLAAGLSPDEASQLLAPLLARTWVHANVLTPFDRTDPLTKRALAKAHAVRARDFPYHLLVAGRLPRGASKDPRPGQKALDKAAAQAAKDQAKASRGQR